MSKIQENYNYFAKFIKFPQDKYTAFSVSFKQEDNSYINYKFFCFEKYDWLSEDNNKIKIDKIISVELGYWLNPKTQINEPQFSITAEISPSEDTQNTNSYVDNSFYDDTPKVESEFGSSTIDIHSDDLPW